MQEILKTLGLAAVNDGTSTGLNFMGSGEIISSYSPVDGKHIADVKSTTKEEYEQVILTAQKAYQEWRLMPAPKRGEIVRQFGEKLRAKKDALGRLVSYEMGKSLQEGWGEVQE
ncbi:MAG: hypothetical protein RLZZ205_53, partial [Bacteroidota bacterium]